MSLLENGANKEQLQELMSFMASQINVPTIGIGGGYAPIGTINFFDAITAPQDWLACDGTVYNIADYPQLANWYEAQHGSKNFYGGDGTTTFAVPDLQGEFLRGTGTNSHNNQGSGANIGSHQDSTEVGNLSLVHGGSYGVFQYDSDTVINTYNDFIVNKDAELPIERKSYARVEFSSGGNISTGKSRGTIRPTNTSFLICVKAIVAGEVYSLNERVVGTWIDGKKIYQKTVTGTTGTTTTQGINADVYIDVGASVDKYIFIEGFVNFDGSDIKIGNSVYGNGGLGQVYAVGLDNNFSSENKNKIHVRNTMPAYSNKPVTIIVQYTKTTD